MTAMWVKTHKALDDFFQVLTCKKCNRRLQNPQQFLNCGHFACAECIRNTDCLICKVPGEVSDIYSDIALNEILANLNIIADAVGLPLKNNSQYDSAHNSADDLKKNKMKEQKSKTVTKKIINETLNTSSAESTKSKSITKRSETLPKNIDKKNKKGESHLHIACRVNNKERVKLLLEAGANPNTKDNAGWTPLQEAVSYGFYEVSEMLLKAGASPNLCGCDNRTALHEAVIINDCDLASLLIQANANKKVYDNVGKKPRDYCKSQEMSNLFRSLQDCEENVPDTANETQKIADMDKTLNCTFSEPKLVLYGSELSLTSKKLLAKFAKKVKISNTLSKTVSHVVVDTDSNNFLKLSVELLLAILHGKLIISSNFLDVLMESTNVTADELNLFVVEPPQLDDGPARARANFEMQNPKLFNNCCFYFCIKKNESIKYDGVRLKKEDLSKLVAAGDGVLLTREPKPEDIQGSISPFHVAHDPKHSLHKCTHYIIYVVENSISQSNRIIYNMPMLKTLPLMWFIESILRFKLIDPVDLGLSAE